MKELSRKQEILFPLFIILFLFFSFGDVLGVMNIISGLVLYVPQLREVIRNKSAGAMSLITTTIQTLGSVPFI